MARIFITGSADGLGHLAAAFLIKEGHQVVLHGRNSDRAALALSKLPKAEAVVTGNLSNIDETKQLAASLNAMGHFDAIIHNAGVYRTTGQEIFKVNMLAPYILTCLIHRPQRLIYLSSGMHLQGDSSLKNVLENTDSTTYADSKLQVLTLAMAVARKWPEVYSNAVNPGWVATKMGGSGAPDDLEKGFQTQAWLAVSEDARAKVSGHYFYHQKEGQYRKESQNEGLQEKLLSDCEKISGVRFSTD